MKIIEVRKQLIRAVRGKRTQSQINRKLALHKNRISRWESGYSNISWSEFVRFCRVCEVDIAPALRSVFGFHDSPVRADLLVRHLVGDRQIAQILKRSGVSRYTLSRWMSGKTDPTLDQILSLIDRLHFLLPEFVEAILGDKKLPAVEGKALELREQKRFHRDFPWASALLRCLELREYHELPRHEDGFVSKKIGVTLSEEKGAFARLLSLGVIRMGENGKYEEVQAFLDTREDSGDHFRIFHYWANRAETFLSSLVSKPPKSILGYSVWAVSPKSAQLIRDAYCEFYYKVRAIAASDEGVAENVQVLSFQLLDLEEISSAGRKKEEDKP